MESYEQENNVNNCLLRLVDADLGYQYPILKNFSLEIRSGEFVAILGPNGCGKSTILKSLIGIIPLLSGRKEVLGQSNANPWDFPGRISYVPQKVALNRSMPMTVHEFFKLKSGSLIAAMPGKKPIFGGKGWFRNKFFDFCAIDFWGPSIPKAHVLNALETVEMSHYIDRKLTQLSGGEFQRIMLAFALLGTPSIVFLDEVAEGLDIKSQENLFRLIRGMMTKREMAVIMISHDISAVTEAATRVICISNNVLYDGSPKNQEFHSCLHKMYGEDSLIHGHKHH